MSDTTTDDTVLVTGPTGNVGEELVRQLLQEGYNVRAGGTQFGDSKKADAYKAAVAGSGTNSGVETTKLDFTDSTTFKSACAGTTRLFLLRPPAISKVKVIAPLIDEFVRQGGKQIVFLSVLGAETKSYIPHSKIERYIEQQSGVHWTFLRPSFFMQNLTTTHAREIRDGDELFVPVGHAKTSFIDTRDIATVAAVILSSPDFGSKHHQQAYDLSGPVALTYFQVAEILSKVLKRNIVYKNPSAIRFLSRHIWEGVHGFGKSIVMTGLYMVTKRGGGAKVTTVFHELTNREPITLEQFAEEYKDVWRKQGLEMVATLENKNTRSKI